MKRLHCMCSCYYKLSLTELDFYSSKAGHYLDKTKNISVPNEKNIFNILMSFLKSIAVLISQVCFFCFVCVAQRNQIDSLQKLLPSLHSEAKVNCLNELSKYYCNYTLSKHYKHYARTDSAELCANEAYSEAVALNYRLGIADAFLNLGEIYLVRFNFFIAQKYLGKAIPLFKELKVEPQLIHAYMSLIDALFYECDIPSIRNKIEIPLRYYKNIHAISEEAGVWGYLWECDIWEGHSEKAFVSLQADFNLIKNLTDPASVLNVLYRKEQLYQIAEWFDSAASYSAKIIAYKKQMGLDTAGINDKAFKYFMEGKWDSSQYYYKQTHNLIISYKGIDSIMKNRMILRNDIDIASLYQRLGKYQEALPIFMKALQYDRKNNVIIEELEVLLNISQIYELEGKDNDAIHYVQKLLTLAQKTEASHYIKNAYQLLWEIYDKRKDSAMAYNYYLKYTELKDSAITDTYRRKLAVINELTKEKEQQAQIAALNKDNKLKESSIRKNAVIRNILIGCVVVLFALGFGVYGIIDLKRKNEKLERARLHHSWEIEKIENEKKQSDFQTKAFELEMLALRTQMNPHFIFNSLNSINRFILQNNRAQASEYLIKFSRLMRMILQNSQNSLITLESELESLELYLEMESLRFDYHFNYKISIPNDLDISVLKVPPLIIQPYVENAIWHGLMHKEEKGELDIEVSQESDHLFFKITDDGIGRKKAAELASKSATKHKSMGLRITADRIAMMQSSKGNESPITINDLINADGTAAGTEVIIKMPVIYD